MVLKPMTPKVRKRKGKLENVKMTMKVLLAQMKNWQKNKKSMIELIYTFDLVLSTIFT